MASNGTVDIPVQTITPENHSGYLTISAALLLVASLLAYGLRLGVRFGFNASFQSDDILLTAGTILAITQSVVTIVAGYQGIGQNVDLLSENQLLIAEKLFYASNLLYVATMALSRASASQLVARLTRRQDHSNACAMVSLVIGIWGLASFVAIGVGCRPYRAWDLSDRCSTLTASWAAIESIGIVLEVALLCLPVYLIWDLQMARLLKSMVLMAFSFRLPIIPLVAARISALNSIKNSTDYTFDVVNSVIFAQVIMHYSLIAATIPCSRPVLKALGTGYMAPIADQVDPVLREQNTRGDSYALSSKEASTKSKHRSSFFSLPSTLRMNETSHRISSISETSPDTSPPQIPLLTHPGRPTSAVDNYLNSVTQVSHGSAASSREASLRIPASAGSDKLIIKKTIGYAVQTYSGPEGDDAQDTKN